MTSLGDVDHTHPETGKSFGESVRHRRGPAPVSSAGADAESDADTERRVTADGGRTDETDTLADVPHAEDVGVQTVYERGNR